MSIVILSSLFLGFFTPAQNPTPPPSAIEESSSPVTSDFKSKNFGELADAYAKGRKGYSNQVFDLLMQNISPKKKVLDLGCGTGISTFQLGEKFDEVQGCDHDPKMLEVARKTAQKPDLFKEGSVYNLPYDDEAFGLVTMFSSYHWYCNQEATKEIHRVIEKDGFVYVVNGGGSPLNKQFHEILEASLPHKIEHPIRSGNYDPEKMLAENGFKIVAKQEFKVTKTYTVEEAIQRMKSYSGWNDIIKAQKEDEVSEKLERLCKEHVDKNGLLHSEATEKVILAQKITIN